MENVKKIHTALSLLNRVERKEIVRRHLWNKYGNNLNIIALVFDVTEACAYNWVQGVRIPAGKNLRKMEEDMGDDTLVMKGLPHYTAEESHELLEHGTIVAYHLHPMRVLYGSLFTLS